MFDSFQHLNEAHEDGLETELSLAVSEEFFQAWPKDLHDHDVVVALYDCPFHLGNSFFCVKLTYFLLKVVTVLLHKEFMDALFCLTLFLERLPPQF